MVEYMQSNNHACGNIPHILLNINHSSHFMSSMTVCGTKYEDGKLEKVRWSLPRGLWTNRRCTKICQVQEEPSLLYFFFVICFLTIELWMWRNKNSSHRISPREPRNTWKTAPWQMKRKMTDLCQILVPPGN